MRYSLAGHLTFADVYTFTEGESPSHIMEQSGHCHVPDYIQQIIESFVLRIFSNAKIRSQVYADLLFLIFYFQNITVTDSEHFQPNR